MMRFAPRLIARCALLLCAAVIGMLCTVDFAYAAGPITLADCSSGSGFPPEAITGPIVYCVQKTVMQAVSAMLASVSAYIQLTVAAACVLAVTIHGSKIMAAEREFASSTIAFLIKIGIVVTFSSNLGGLTGMVFAVMGELLNWAVGGYSPWTTIDNFLGTLFGFAPGIALFQGLIWLGAGLVSGTSSFAMSSGLIIAFIELILFVVEIVYTYLTCILVVGFMIIFSPIFIPTALFQYSERFFKKWLDTMIGAMLVPVFLFGFLAMTLGVFNSLICNLFVIILPGYSCQIPTDPGAPPDFHQFWKINEPAFSWLMPTDPNFTNAIRKKTAEDGNREKLVPPVQIVINPFDRAGFNANAFNLPGINFGLDNGKTNQKLLFALISLWIYAAIMKEMIERMPGVAQEIAGSASGIALKRSNLKAKIAEFTREVKAGSATIGGAALGGQIGGAVSRNPVAAEAGALTGAAIGNAAGGGILGNILARKR